MATQADGSGSKKAESGKRGRCGRRVSETVFSSACDREVRPGWPGCCVSCKEARVAVRSRSGRRKFPRKGHGSLIRRKKKR